jgi:dipeptidyl aminopeptidase/acylaminoacyl peptidase
MKRGNLPAIPLALLCLVLGACARLSAPQARSTPADDRIALSVLSDAVYLVDPDTGERTMLVGDLADFQSGYAAWAPDRTRLAYASGGIFIRNSKTGEDTALVQGSMLSMPAWSPDGQSIAYGNGSALWIAAAQAGALPDQIRIPATLAPLGMDWGTTNSIVFEGLARDCAQAFDCPSTDQSEIWVVDPDATGLRQLTHVGHAERPKWSPDGTQILFLRRAAGKVDQPRQLWVINADGSAPRRVLGTDGVVAADWSPDGRLIAMARTGSAGTLQLWIARSDGSNAQPVGSALSGTEATLDW